MNVAIFKILNNKKFKQRKQQRGGFFNNFFLTLKNILHSIFLKLNNTLSVKFEEDCLKNEGGDIF